MLGEERCRKYPVPEDVEAISDIAVSGRNPEEVAVDIYRPASLPKESMPVIVFVHGGGLFIGDRRFNRPFATKMAREGFLVYICDYRLIDKADAFGMISDMNAVYGLVKETASGYGGDMERVFVIGESAGAFLAEYSVAAEKSGLLREMYGITPSGINIRGVVFFSGMFYTTRIDLVGLVYSKDLYGKKLKDKRFKALTDPEDPEIMDNLPPVFMTSSRGDFLRNYTIRYAGALLKRKHSCEMVYFKKAGHLRHAFVSVEPELSESIGTIKKMIRWMRGIVV